jgi:hypothetical protein
MKEYVIIILFEEMKGYYPERILCIDCYGKEVKDNVEKVNY